MIALKPDEVEVVIHTHKVYCEGEINTPFVESVRKGARVTDHQLHLAVREALDDWYRSKRHEHEEDQEGDAQGPQEGSGAAIDGDAPEAAHADAQGGPEGPAD